MERQQISVTLPVLHLNGSGKDRLIDALLEAATVLREAQEKVAVTAPNARDFYPRGPEALRQATTEHEERLRRLRDTADEIEALAIGISDGGWRA